MAGFNSFEPLLRKWLQKIKPVCILEFGPGRSTEIMIEECPNAKVYSLETNRDWYRKYFARYKNNRNVNMILVPETFLADAARGWKKMYDFIFVDGLCDKRVDCLKTAKDLILRYGVVMLHDSERVKYKAGTDLFIKVEESNGTLVMKSKRGQ